MGIVFLVTSLVLHKSSILTVIPILTYFLFPKEKSIVKQNVWVSSYLFSQKCLIAILILLFPYLFTDIVLCIMLDANIIFSVMTENIANGYNAGSTDCTEDDICPSGNLCSNGYCIGKMWPTIMSLHLFNFKT